MPIETLVSCNQREFTERLQTAATARVFTTFVTHLSAAGPALFRIEWHLERLAQNALEIGFVKEARAAQVDLYEALKLGLREVGTFTNRKLIKCVFDGARLDILVTDFDAAARPQSAKLLPYRGTRVQPQLKSTVGETSASARAEALRVGCDEALLIDHNGIVREGAWSNVFWIARKRLYTTASAILPGITRRDILEHEECCEKDLSFEELSATADEIFLTQSTTGITAVHAVGDHTYGHSHTEQLRKRLHHRIFNESVALVEILK